MKNYTKTKVIRITQTQYETLHKMQSLKVEFDLSYDSFVDVKARGLHDNIKIKKQLVTNSEVVFIKSQLN